MNHVDGNNIESQFTIIERCDDNTNLNLPNDTTIVPVPVVGVTQNSNENNGKNTHVKFFFCLK